MSASAASDPDSAAQQPGRLAFPASGAQERLWFLRQRTPDDTCDNMALAFRISGDLDRDALAAALADLVDRHEPLRTVLEHSGDGLQQVVLARAELPLPLPVTELARGGTADRAGAVRSAIAGLAHRPFDLSGEPPIRAGLLRLAESEHVLVVCVHRIMVDGWAMGILVRELGAAYRARSTGRAPALPELPIQYADWSEWQRQRYGERAQAAGVAYWRERLAGRPPVLELPGDRPRPAQQSCVGARLELELPAALTALLRGFCRERAVTLYPALLAGYAAFLARHTGSGDIIVGTPFTNRDDPQVRPLVGSFATVAPIRLALHDAPSFTALVDRAEEALLGARAHDHIRLETVMAEVAAERVAARGTLVQAVLGLQDVGMPALELGGPKAAQLLVEADATRYDLEFHVRDDGGALRVLVVYSTDLFDPPTVRRLARRWVRLLESAVAAPRLPVTRLDLLTDEERAALAAGLRRPRHPEPVPLAERLTRPAADRPQEVAVVDGAARTTWRELDEAAARLASRLTAAGVGPGSRLAVAAPPGGSAIRALLAALRAGAAIVGLDPADPPGRNRDLVRRSGALAVLTDAEGPWGVPTIPLGDPESGSADPAGPVPADQRPALVEWSDHGPLAIDGSALAAQTALLADAAGVHRAGSVALDAPAGSPAFVRGALAALATGARLVLDGGGADLVLTAEPPAGAPEARTVVLAPPAPGGAAGCARVALAPGVGPYALAAVGEPDFAPLLPMSVLDPEGGHCPWGVEGTVWAAGVLSPAGHRTPAQDTRTPSAPGGTVAGLPECADPFAAGLRLRPVDRRGRITPGGRLTAGESAGAGVVLGGQWVDPAGVERALLEQDPVADCRVTARRAVDGALALVAYVVPCDAVRRDRLAAVARQALPAGAPGVRVVVVSGLPRTASGAVDLVALHRLPVLDEELAAAWERGLIAEGAAAQAVAVVAENPPPAAGWIRLGVRRPGAEGGAGRTSAAPQPLAVSDGGRREPYPRALPNWFHRPVWQPADAPRTPPAAGERAHTVVLADPGEALASRIAALVRAGGGRCTVLAADSAGEEAVDRADRVLDLRLSGPVDRGPEPVAALVSLLRGQAAVRAGTGRPLVLDVVATGSRAGLGAAPAPRRAAAVAVLKSAVRELPWLSGRWIDADPADDPEATARLLRAEGSTPVTDLDIAYRGGVRRVLRLEQLPPPPAAPVLRTGGHYLITGGLGGPAAETARHLLDTYRASVTLVGRTRPADAPGRAAAVLGGLRTLGQVRYLTADVTDRTAVHRALSEARAQHGGVLDGVLHLAEVVEEERPLAETDAGHWERALAARTVGAEHLLDMLADRLDTLFVAYSSVHGTFGGAHAAACAAACAQLDALIVRRWAAGMRVQSIAWGGWEQRGTGPDRTRNRPSRPRGCPPLSPREAMCSLDAALRHREPQLLVGLDPRTPWVRGLTAGPVHPLHRLVVHLVPGPRPEGAGGRSADPPADAFGTPVPGTRVRHVSLPRTADGAPGRARPADEVPADPAGPTEPPSGATERALAELWCALLAVDRVGRHDDFFDLGGSSLLAARLAGRIRTVLGRDIQVAGLVEHPTVAALAAHLDQDAEAALFAVHLPLRPAGSGTPLFCFHPGGGTSWPYAPLLRHLDPCIPVHGIQARGLRAPAHMPATIEEMADDYTRQIRARRPHGPYALLGWSMGGFVAHAVAARLQRAGEHVALLAILDSYPLRDADIATLPAAQELEGVLLNLLLDGAGAAPTQDAAPPDRTRTVAALRRGGSVLAEVGEAGLGRMVDVMRHNTGLLTGHTPGVVDGDLLLFAARRGYPVDAPPPAERWRPHLSGRVVEHRLDCTHQEILRPEQLPHLASALNARLAPTEGPPV
ncbi:hypothetical protein ACZ90_45130 [Streptomyces albus subsp. albus]|nr:hypothetical protein ACZ90_45130 [Streptomyces albus subsp. albus]